MTVVGHRKLQLNLVRLQIFYRSKSPVVGIMFVLLTRWPCFSEGICVKCKKMLSVYKGQVPEAGHMSEEVAKIPDSLSELNLVSM